MSVRSDGRCVGAVGSSVVRSLARSLVLSLGFSSAWNRSGYPHLCVLSLCVFLYRTRSFEFRVFLTVPSHGGVCEGSSPANYIHISRSLLLLPVLEDPPRRDDRLPTHKSHSSLSLHSHFQHSSYRNTRRSLIDVESLRAVLLHILVSSSSHTQTHKCRIPETRLRQVSNHGRANAIVGFDSNNIRSKDLHRRVVRQATLSRFRSVK